jgi:hypothetical protein
MQYFNKQIHVLAIYNHRSHYIVIDFNVGTPTVQAVKMYSNFSPNSAVFGNPLQTGTPSGLFTML